MPDPSSSGKAVFISYAREDTDAARRVADASALLNDPKNNAPLF